MDPTKLNSFQKRIYRALKKNQDKPKSLSEMAKIIRVRNKNALSYHIKRLDYLGYINYRSIEDYDIIDRIIINVGEV